MKKPGDTIYFIHRAQLLMGTLRRLKKNGVWMVDVPNHDNECACGAVVFDILPADFRDETGERT